MRCSVAVKTVHVHVNYDIMDQCASCIMAHLYHLSLVFGLTKPTVLEKTHFS